MPNTPQNLLYTNEKILVNVYTNEVEASVAVAKEILRLIKNHNDLNKKTVLGLATGGTPLLVYSELIKQSKQDGLSFQKVITFNLDEYFDLNREDRNSYFRYMQKNLFQHLDIKPENCHLPKGDISVDEITRHCEEYEKKIQDFGGIDLQLLGIGKNGHIGFNEPGSNPNSKTRLITLASQTRKDASKSFGGFEYVPKKAITMGVKTILQAKKIILLGLGESKAEAIEKSVEHSLSEQVPASFLQNHDNAKIVADSSASKLLSRFKMPWIYETVEWTDSLLKKAVTKLSLKIKKPILKLSNSDYNENDLSDLLAKYGDCHEINLLHHTIPGWPGGKPHADVSHRPERADPAKKRVLIFSPHPDDDIISMGGTFQRLVNQNHDVHVAYQTSGNIAVSDGDAFRFLTFTKQFFQKLPIEVPELTPLYEETKHFLLQKNKGEKDSSTVQLIKGLIRQGEARATGDYVGLKESNMHFLNLPFYETGTIEKNPLSEKDYTIICDLIQTIKPHQIYAARDLADPHGTHKTCLEAILESVKKLQKEPYMKDCWIWLYKGAWDEWDLHEIEMAVPMSPAQVFQKRYGIFKHQSQKDGVVFQGKDSREFWQRAEDRNKNTANLYRKLGFAEYSAIEAFVRWKN